MAENPWASSDAFDFEHAFDLPPSSAQTRDDPFDVPPPASRPAEQFLEPYATAVRPVLPTTSLPLSAPAIVRTRRGQSLAWTAVVIGVACSGFIGLGLYQAFAGLHMRMRLTDFTDWTTVVAIGLCGTAVALALGIVAAVRSRPKGVAALAIVVALVLPLVAAILGIKFGIDTALAAAANGATQLVASVTDLLGGGSYSWVADLLKLVVG